MYILFSFIRYFMNSKYYSYINCSTDCSLRTRIFRKNYSDHVNLLSLSINPGIISYIYYYYVLA